MPTRRSDLLALLERYDLRLLRERDQHFLVDERVRERLLAAADLSGEDAVLEVGAGVGTLTAALAERAGQVLSVERDLRLRAALEESLTGYNNVTMVWGNALELDLAGLCRQLQPRRPWKVVANIPYGITGPLVARLVEAPDVFTILVLMVQREVAQRMVAAPGSKAYGAFTLLVQSAGRCRMVARVPRTAFFPPPEVDSAVIRFDSEPRLPPDVPRERFLQVVRTAFGQRRKMLRNALAGLVPEGAVDEWLAAAGVSGRERAEEVALEGFVKLVRAWPAHAPG